MVELFIWLVNLGLVIGQKSSQKDEYIIRTEVRKKGLIGFIQHIVFGKEEVYILSGKDSIKKLKSDLHNNIMRLFNMKKEAWIK